MDAQQFLTEFGHIAKAPGGISRLRELVLQLAVQGRLVVPPVADGSSSVLLNRILKVRSQLTADKKLPREKSYPSLPKSERTADAPQHWQWAYFGEVWQLLSGRDMAPHQYNDSRTGVPYITGASNIDDGLIEVNRWTPEPVVISMAGDLLITCKGTIGKTAFNKVGDAHIARQLMAIRDFSGELEPRFLKIWLDGFVGELVKKSKSMIPGFSREDLIFAAYPVFSREEQLSIVARVDDLMVLCDQLEHLQQDCRKLQNALRLSTLQTLASAQSPHELQTSWQRLQANFGGLFSDPEDVRDFKGLVLDLAVSGQLLTPSRAPASASELLERIASARSTWSETAKDQEKKESVAMAKKLRIQHVKAPDVTLPSHWCWASMLQIAQVIIDCDHKTPIYAADGIHLIRTTDIRDGQMRLDATKKTSEEVFQQRSRRLVPRAEDIFFTREAPMGEAAMVPRGVRVGLGQRLMLIRLFNDLFNPQFLLYVVQSPSFKVRLMESAVGMTVKHINVGDVESLQIPVPPRGEQDQIVEMLDQLFGRCATYTEQLVQARKTAEQLARAAVASLTGINIEQDEDTAVKAPQTELIASLRLATPPNVKAQAPLATILARHQGEMAARDLWQRFGGDIDAFYAQLKTEVAQGWIDDPSYVLDDDAPAGPKKYPDGAQVARVKVKEEA